MDPVSRSFLKSQSTAPIECYCQDAQPVYDANWNELEEYWGAEKYRLQLEIQLQSLSSSLEHQLLYEDCLKTPEVPEPETRSKEPNYLYLSDSSYVVHGEDINDIPSSYVIKGIEEHEFPVIGTYVDRRIVPGFRYKVRLNKTEKYLFDGQALLLKSVGMGYGKRLVFEDKRPKLVDNYFWSDTYHEGYGFCIEAIQEGDKFDIRQTDESPKLGTVVVTECQIGQQELDMAITKDGNIEKTVRVDFWIDVKSSLVTGSSYRVTGEALLSKLKNCPQAILKRIYLTDFVLKNCCLFPLP